LKSILRVRVKMSLANYDPDFDLAKESHQIALTALAFNDPEITNE
jgi:hypothetical protein